VGSTRIYKEIKLISIISLGGIFLGGLVFCISQAQQSIQDLRTDQALKEARDVSGELADEVRGLLLQEIGKGGFVNAVKVCSESAQKITKRFNERPGHIGRRISLRHRNPKNIPDDYERRKLEEFDLLNHERRLGNDYFEVVKEDGLEYLRYMKPLIAIPLCMNCHGPKENIPSEVRIILSEKYPEDRAIGFRVGDVRGAISIKIALPLRQPKDK